MADTAGLVGVGAMGSALLKRLVLAGCAVKAYDILDERTAEAAKAGAEAAASPKAAADAGPLRNPNVRFGSKGDIRLTTQFSINSLTSIRRKPCVPSTVLRDRVEDINHLAFNIDTGTYESIRAHLEEAGLEISGRRGDDRCIYFSDPDGHRLQIVVPD